MNKTCETDTDCQIGYTGTLCSTCSSGVCKNNTYKEGDSCTFDDGTIGQCAQGICQPKSGCTYTENVCTGKNEYCASPNTSNYEAFPEGETGVCVTADIRRFEYGGRVYFISNPGLSWWDARAFCDALGLDFPPKKELYQDGKRTELTKKLREIAGRGFPSIWHDEEWPGTADSLAADSDSDSIWVKTSRPHGFAVCR